MSFHRAAFLLDENVHPELEVFLRTRGFDNLTARQAGLFGLGDRRVLHRACSEQRIVVTHDADFGALAVAAREPVFGIIYLRPGHIKPAVSIDTLRALLKANLYLAYRLASWCLIL